MLSDYELNVLRVTLTLVLKLRMASISYTDGILYTTKESYKAKLSRYVHLGILLAIIFICSAEMKKAPAEKRVMLLFLNVVALTGAGCRLTVWFRTAEFAFLCNNLLQMNRLLGGFANVKKVEYNGINLRSRAYVTVLFSIGICILISTIQNYVTNFDILNQNVWFHGIYVLALFPYSLYYFHDLVIIAATFVPSVFVSMFWLTKSCIVWPTESRDVSSPLLINDWFYIYRCIALLNCVHNIAFGTIFIPTMKLACVCCVFITAYCVIRMRDILSTAIYSFFFMYLFSLILIIVPGAIIMSQVYNISRNIHRNVGLVVKSTKGVPKTEKLELEKSLKSLQVLKCTIGSFYHMEAMAKLTLADNIARGIAFSLMTSM